MKSILRFVSAKERLPSKTGLYHTNRGMINYFHGLGAFEHSTHIDYWLEEIELPTNEEIEGFSFSYRTTIQQGGGFIRGAKFIRDRYLAGSVRD